MRSLERIAAWGQGWAALMGGPQLAQTARTTSLTSLADLRGRIDDLEQRLAEHGRRLSDIDILVPAAAGDLTRDWSAQQRLDELGMLTELGVTWVGVVVPCESHSSCLERIEEFGDEVIAKLT